MQTFREPEAVGCVGPQRILLTESELQTYFDDDRWWVQEKFAGTRLLILKEGDVITATDLQGVVIELPAPIVEAAREVNSQRCLMEGDLIGEKWVAVDLLEEATLDLRADPFDLRYGHLTDKVSKVRSRALQLAPVAMSSDEKRAMLQELKARSALGVILKRCDAPDSLEHCAGGGSQLAYEFRREHFLSRGSES